MKNEKRKKKNSLAMEEEVLKRYGIGARERQENLCCPVEYDKKYLEILPREIIEKDYGCGDPSKYLREGDHVLDLGSGSGKICYIAAQIVGSRGRVTGVDFNDEMLSLARKYQDEMAAKLGYSNVQFKKGRIQDLKVDLSLLDAYLKKRAVNSLNAFFDFDAYREGLIQTKPLIPDASIDVVVSSCVLNLVQAKDKEKLFSEIHRVLKKGGRVAISDIVSDEDVPMELQNDPELWTGCISGAFREDLFLKAFEAAGFYGIKIESVGREPFQTVWGIEFRSVTVTAYKGKEGPCLERNQAVIYKGPWKQVVDDDKHVLKRGVRTAVCDKTHHIYASAPYMNDIILVSPRKEVPLSKAGVFDCHRAETRHPRETKGLHYKKNTEVKGRLRFALPPPARGLSPRAGTASEPRAKPGASSAVKGPACDTRGSCC